MRRKHQSNRYGWSPFELNFIRCHFNTLTNLQLSKMLGIKLTSLRMKCYEIGLKRMEMEYWTEDQINYLKANYKTVGDVELAERFEKLWPKQKKWTNKHIEKKRKYLKLIRTVTEVEKVKERNIETGRFAECAVKRWKVSEACAEGTVKIWRYAGGNAFKVIKLKTGFVHFMPWLYEQMFGPIPVGYMVRTKDGDNMNVVPENLILVTRAQHALINSSISIGSLSDNYIIGILASGKNKALRESIAANPELIEVKRLQLQLNRMINGKDNRKEASGAA